MWDILISRTGLYLGISCILFIKCITTNTKIINKCLPLYSTTICKFEKYYSKIQNTYINPIIKYYYENQRDIVFLDTGKEIYEYHHNNINNAKIPIFPYDTVVRLFLIEHNNNFNIYCRIQDHYSRELMYNNFVLSNIKFISIILNNFNDNINLHDYGYNFYVAGNKLFESSFIKWLTGIKQLDIDYSIVIIDHNAKLVTLTKNNYILLKSDGYEIISKTSINNDPFLELLDNIPKNINKNKDENKCEDDCESDCEDDCEEISESDCESDCEEISESECESESGSDEINENSYWTNLSTFEFEVLNNKS